VVVGNSSLNVELSRSDVLAIGRARLACSNSPNARDQSLVTEQESSVGKLASLATPLMGFSMKKLSPTSFATLFLRLQP
jgi:hypothetical protein